MRLSIFLTLLFILSSITRILRRCFCLRLCHRFFYRNVPYHMIRRMFTSGFYHIDRPINIRLIHVKLFPGTVLCFMQGNFHLVRLNLKPREITFHIKCTSYYYLIVTGSYDLLCRKHIPDRIQRRGLHFKGCRFRLCRISSQRLCYCCQDCHNR